MVPIRDSIVGSAHSTQRLILADAKGGLEASWLWIWRGIIGLAAGKTPLIRVKTDGKASIRNLGRMLKE